MIWLLLQVLLPEKSVNIPLEIVVALIPALFTLLAVFYRIGKTEENFKGEIQNIRYIIDASVSKESNSVHLLSLKLETSDNTIKKDFMDVWDTVNCGRKNLDEHTKRLNRIERFLIKTTEFDKRTDT